MSDAPAPPAGPAVDARGVPVVDPTANVSALVEAGLGKEAALREMTERYLRELIERDRQHAAELREAEAKRIDAIRAVDVAAAEAARNEARVLADTLAKQQVTLAETLRTSTAGEISPLRTDIADLRRVQYEQAGRSGAQTESRDTNQWVVGVLVGFVIFLISIGVSSAIALSR